MTEPENDAATAPDAAPADAASPAAAASDPHVSHGWGEWGVAAVLLAMGVVVLLDGLGQRASTSASGIGAGFMPVVVGGLLLVLTALLVVQLLRGRRGEAEQAEGDVDVRSTKWIPMLATIAALFFFVFAVEFLGYMPTAIVMFWVIAWAMGSRKYLMNLLIAVVLAVIVYFAFTRLLTIHLPAGFLEGIV